MRANIVRVGRSIGRSAVEHKPAQVVSQPLIVQTRAREWHPAIARVATGIRAGLGASRRLRHAARRRARSEDHGRRNSARAEKIIETLLQPVLEP